MERTLGNWILWIVFMVSLALVAYNMITQTKPTQPLLIIQLLGLGCGVIIIVRNKSNKR